MASPRLFHFFFLVPMLLMMIINPSHSSREMVIEDPKKVNVSLYFETLCPSCESYIVKDLGDLFKDPELMSIVNLHLVPYGNAHISKNGIVECQHGPDECLYNTIEACVLDGWPLGTSFSFIQCVEAALLQGKDNKTSILRCCEELRLDVAYIASCYESGHGDELIRGYGRETGALIPPHEYVPWVTLNGNPLKNEMHHLTEHICDAYKGKRKIKACNNVHVATSLTRMMKSTQAVCHVDLESGSPIITM